MADQQTVAKEYFQNEASKDKSKAFHSAIADYIVDTLGCYSGHDFRAMFRADTDFESKVVSHVRFEEGVGAAAAGRIQT